MPLDQASVPVNNGLLSGEGIFTTIKVKQGVALFFAKHQQRLFSHMADLRFSQTSFDFSLEKAVQELTKINKINDCAMRITVINTDTKPIVIMQARELPESKTDVKAITVQDTRDSFKTIKTINRLVNREAYMKAEKTGCDEALFVQDGKIIESTYCNVFSINNEDKLITPALDGKGLKGIARQIIMENTKVFEEDIDENTTNPLVLVNSLRVQQVKLLNNRELADGTFLFKKIKTIIENAKNEYVTNYRYDKNT